MRTVFMFSGQGSQYYQMGKDLYNKNEMFRKNLDIINLSIYSEIQTSLIEYIYDPIQPIGTPLNKHLFSSLSLYMVEMALYSTLIECGIKPDVLLGSSFGTLIACIAAGSIDNEYAIRLIIQLTNALDNHCAPGKMSLIIGNIKNLILNPLLSTRCEIAGINFSDSFVVAYPKATADMFEADLKSEGYSIHDMPVTKAFHSSWINEMQPHLQKICESITYKPPNRPLICTSLPQLQYEVSFSTIWNAFRLPMYFPYTLEYLERRGTFNYIDLSPSGTLASFSNKALGTNSNSKIFPVLNPFARGQENLNKILSTYK